MARGTRPTGSVMRALQMNLLGFAMLTPIYGLTPTYGATGLQVHAIPI